MSKPILDVVLPQLGMGMSEGKIVEWHVPEGARVERDQLLLSIENEKTVSELPAPAGGHVHFIANIGDTLPIETLIAQIAHTEAAYRALLDGPGPAAAEESPQSDGSRVSETQLAARPAAIGGASTPKRVRASGLAKVLASQAGLDLAQLSGTGPYGRILKRDILDAVERRRLTEAPTTAVQNPSQQAASPREAMAGDPRTPLARLPLVGARRTIAERMVQASTEAAQTFVYFEIDATKLTATRKLIDDRLGSEEIKTTALAYYARAIALACQRVPIANATLEDGEIVLWNEVNIGIAVARPGATQFDSSLVVPVVHNAQSLGVLGLSNRIREQAQKARDGRMGPADVSHGTITISSNAGMFPGLWVHSTPLLNLPQAVIFQPGNATKRPVVVDDEIVIRTMLPCSLTFDHRILDGEPTAHFIRELAGFLTDPETMML